MLRAYVSWLQLFSDFMFDVRGKIATLWFDELILQVPREDMISNVLEKVGEEEKWKDSTLKELKKIQVPVKNYLPTYQFLQKNPWECDYKPLVEIAEEVTKEETLKEAGDMPLNHPAVRHEIAMAGAGLIESVELWMLLNSKNLCTFLPCDREQKVLKQLFYSASKATELDSFSEILSSRIPDINSYSWDEIIELRNHPFFNSFREKVVCLHQQLSSGNSSTVVEIVDELAHKDMKEMIDVFRPSMKKSVIKGIISNIPLPIPVNPLSILFSGKEIKHDIDISNKYGWIYFLMDISKDK